MEYRYRIEDATFSDQTVVALKDLVVLIGPNNCGKSRALKDLVALTCTDNPDPVVICAAQHTRPRDAEPLANQYGIKPTRGSDGGLLFRSLQPTLVGENHYNLAKLRWPEDCGHIMRDAGVFKLRFAPQLTAFLTTENRLSLVSENDSARHASAAQHLLQVFYDAGPEEELRLRKLVKAAFPPIEVALDFTIAGRIQFRIGEDFSALPPDPRQAKPVLSGCKRLDDQGDGLRSYVGLLAALTALNRPVFLIDEPEAFLHPPQAFRIGELIAKEASGDKQIIVATHSADVLRGIIFNSTSAQIIRIDRIGDSNTVRVLDQAELKTLVNDPLLSAAGVLDGLFYSGVIVTEADGDARFFQTLSRKLQPSLDLHFVNADNKQTVPKVLAPYKRLGVRCAGIVDIDVLNEKEEFRKQLQAAGLDGAQFAAALAAQDSIAAEINATPPVDRLSDAAKRLSEMVEAVRTASSASREDQDKALAKVRRDSERLKADASAWKEIKKEGASSLRKSREEFDKLYEICSEAGLFINPSGELESSLAGYGVAWESDKRTWMTRALQLLVGLSPDNERQPWKLIDDVHNHLARNKT